MSDLAQSAIDPMSEDLRFRGRAWVFGDNIPTDQLVKSNRVYWPMEEIVKHVLEDQDPEFPVQVQPGDIVVAGLHFGQSSGRAIAPKALKATGISCVVAESFSRTFYRNAFEIGLPILECQGIRAMVQKGDVLDVTLDTGHVVDEGTGKNATGRPIDPFLMNMLRGGGLIPIAAQLVEAES